MDFLEMNANQIAAGPAVKHKGEIERVVLPNGIVLLMAENHTLPMISMSAMVRFGSRYEAEAQAGLATLLGDMLDEGTPTRTAQEIALATEEVGARLSSFGGYSHSGVGLVCLTEDFPGLLALAAEMLTQSTLPEDRFTMRRERVLAQLKSREDEPRAVAADAFAELIYGTHPAHRPSLGYPHTVAGLTRDQLAAAYQRFFVPNNSIFAVVGDFSRRELQAQIEAAFANWQPDPAFSLPEVPTVERQTEPREKIIFKEKEQIQVYLGHLGIQRSNPDFYPLLVMDTILGSSPGMTSRIPRILRDEQGLAYTTFSSITSSAGIDPGRFTAYIGTSPANREKAIRGLRAEIERITTEPVSQEELDIAKSYLTGSFVFNFETNAQVAGFLVEAEVFNLGFDYLETYPEFIRQVTVDDVTRVARQYLDPVNLTTVIVGPVKE
ncbi:MAG TPA: pitrilysin family protein [Acidobacteriota bacterium]|nr:pitrilysin family protein [Acidobacteriota bacterium]